MHPAVILIPVAAMIFGPRLWVSRVMKQHDHEDEAEFASAAELARGWLDAHHLQLVKVEATDLGDHYDPQAKAVRLARDRFDRKSLTAVTTAAHEVSHALQDAADYGPFVLRKRLAALAQVAGQVGTVILLSVPVAGLFSRRPISPVLIGSTLFIMLGSGLALQLAALQTELDASFKRALPMLQEGTVDTAQIRDAKKILIACSLTYVASSILSVMNFWPWLGTRLVDQTQRPQAVGITVAARTSLEQVKSHSMPTSESAGRSRAKSDRRGPAHNLIRKLGKPLVRTWFRLTSLT
ncbi:MAG: zinc metallopeptidase [Gammaproteobacteria bacterium]|nr:zinc metallopeptidase [Gammaproteobacteria bacterium]